MNIRWECPNTHADTFEQALENLKTEQDEFIICCRCEDTKHEWFMQSIKTGDDQYICEVGCGNGSVYSYPGTVTFEELKALFTRFSAGDDFSFVCNNWQKLQNSKGLNFLFVLLVIAAGCGIFIYLHYFHNAP